MKHDRFDNSNVSIRLAITLTAALGGLSLIQSSLGTEKTQYGSAPESLDYPVQSLTLNSEQYGKAHATLLTPKKKASQKTVTKKKLIQREPELPNHSTWAQSVPAGAKKKRSW